MITIITICSRISLYGKNAKSYSGIAFDGQQYYVTNELNSEIAVLDTNFEVIGAIEPNRLYTALCYDAKEKCFWAASKQNEKLLFKLDCDFEEVAHIEIDFDCKCSGMVSGISYCSRSDQLLVCTADCLMLVEKHSGRAKAIQKEGRARGFSGTFCAGPYYMYITNNKTNYYLGLISYDKSIKEKGCVALGCPVEAGLLYPHKDRQGFYHIYFLAHKHAGGAYILDARLDKRLSGLLCDAAGGQALNENDYSSVQNFYKVFGYKKEHEAGEYLLKNNCKYEADTCKPCHDSCGRECEEHGWKEDCCCGADRCKPCHDSCGWECGGHGWKEDCCKPCHDRCDWKDNCCCEADCCRPCHDRCDWKDDCCCEACCCKPCRHDWENKCNHILESIALQEAALAHILNAEGEKLQKAIAEDADVCELLKVNESVYQTIVRVTHLEQVLYAKLEALSKCCPFCGEPSCPKDTSEPAPKPCPSVCQEKEEGELEPCEASDEEIF